MLEAKINHRAAMAQCMKAGVTAALLVIALLIWLPPARGQNQPAHRSAQSESRGVENQRPPALTDEELSELVARIREMIRNEIVQDVGEADKDVIARANETQERADRLQSGVGVVSTGWLSVVTLLFIFLMFFGWQEGSINARQKELGTLLEQTRSVGAQSTQSVQRAAEAADRANQSADRVRNLEGEVENARQRIKATDRAVESSLKTIVDEMPSLIEIFRKLLEKELLVGDAPSLPPFDVVEQFEEADILMVVADNNASIEKKNLTEPLLASECIGDFWRTILGRSLVSRERLRSILPRYWLTED